MVKKILLNNQEFTFTEDDLPILIHGAHRAGSSLLTVTIISQLYMQGSKILFSSGYEMAEDEFKIQVNEFYMNKVEIIKRGYEEDFIRTIDSMKEGDERVLLVKNVERLSEKAFLKFKDKKKLVVSGDLEFCIFKDELLQIPFRTVILFSTLYHYDRVIPDALGQYEGYMWGNKEGVVKIDEV